MELWVFLLLVSIVCAVIGLIRFVEAKASGRSSAKTPVVGGALDSTASLSNVWDETEISSRIAAAGQRPEILPHYIESLKQRFILDTDNRTAQRRTIFLRTQIEQLDLGKQYRVLVDDLKAMELEQNNRILRLELERQDLQAKTRQAVALEKLHFENERLTLELEIGQKKMQKRAIQNPPPEATLTPDQQRRLKRIEIEERIERLDRDEALKVKNARSDEERVRIQNMYADSRDELREQLGKHLV
jgi:hypothetical protein